jgi:hypothetical protein
MIGHSSSIDYTPNFPSKVDHHHHPESIAIIKENLLHHAAAGAVTATGDAAPKHLFSTLALPIPNFNGAEPEVNMVDLLIMHGRALSDNMQHCAHHSLQRTYAAQYHVIEVLMSALMPHPSSVVLLFFFFQSICTFLDHT